MALCGACTVHVGTRRQPFSGITLSTSIGTSEITTIRQSARTAAGRQDPEVPGSTGRSFNAVLQSGQIMSASALLLSNPHPTFRISTTRCPANICRCGTYVRNREAINEAAQNRTGREAEQ